MDSQKTIGITGARGALGKALTKKFKQKGYRIIGFTHTKHNFENEKDSPHEWVNWECGNELTMKKYLKNIDILILNHGIYDVYKENYNFEKSIEINAISKLKILNLFEEISLNNKINLKPREVWINTSEAEILPALNPSYEVSKSLIGQLITFKKNLLNKEAKGKLKIKKIIIGPFKSELNPIGILSPEFVANMIFNISKLNIYLIIISPNPISYLVFPLKELYFYMYCKLLNLKF